MIKYVHDNKNIADHKKGVILMVLKIGIGIVTGGVAGGILGYIAKCTDAACILFSTPWSGIFFGAVIGLIIALVIKPKNKKD